MCPSIHPSSNRCVLYIKRSKCSAYGTPTHHCCLSCLSCFLDSYTTVSPQLETESRSRKMNLVEQQCYDSWAQSPPSGHCVAMRYFILYFYTSLFALFNRCLIECKQIMYLGCLHPQWFYKGWRLIHNKNIFFYFTTTYSADKEKDISK